MAQVRARTPPRQYKRSYSSIKAHERKTSRDFAKKDGSPDQEMNFKSNSTEMFLKPAEYYEECGNNRVMVVVDSSFEAKGALQWALSHTVQNQDTIILLHVSKPSKQGDKFSGGDNQRAYELLSSMKYMCQAMKPGVQVDIVVQEGKEKGVTIVEETKKQKVSLLVLGQRKQSLTWRIQKMWAGKRTRNRAVDYCIQKASCMTIAVRRKSKKHGGYLITTKRHKDFWLLA